MTSLGIARNVTSLSLLTKASCDVSEDGWSRSRWVGGDWNTAAVLVAVNAFLEVMIYSLLQLIDCKVLWFHLSSGFARVFVDAKLTSFSKVLLRAVTSA